MTILLHRAIALGDNVVAIKAIYALKCLYPSAKIIVATNNIGAQIYSKLPFIDALLNIDANPRAIHELEAHRLLHRHASHKRTHRPCQKHKRAENRPPCTPPLTPLASLHQRL